MGHVVGAALVSHHPGLMQDEDFCIRAGAGEDSDLVAGFDRVRTRIDAVAPDVLVILDTHWFTTGFHVVDAGAAYSGTFVSDEMPWYLKGLPYDYRGAPELARLCQTVGEERKVPVKAIDDPALPRHYATLNVVNRLRATERVLTLSNCQTAKTEHFLTMGEVLGEAIRRSDYRVVLLASGALSHEFTDLDFVQRNPRLYHHDNVSDPAHIESDREAIELFKQGAHDVILRNFAQYRAIPWEGLGGHYLQMIGALGGASCRAKGTLLSEYEAARGTGNIHMWFDT